MVTGDIFIVVWLKLGLNWVCSQWARDLSRCEGTGVSLPQPGCSHQSVCWPSIPLLTFHSTLARGYQAPNPILSSIFWKAVLAYLMFLPAEVRILAGIVFLLQSHVEPHKAEEWEWAQKNKRRKQYPLLSCSLAMWVHNVMHLIFFGCAPPKCLLLFSLVKQRVPPQSIRKMHQSHVGTWETSSYLFRNSAGFCLNALSIGNFSVDRLIVLLSYSET